MKLIEALLYILASVAIELFVCFGLVAVESALIGYDFTWKHAVGLYILMVYLRWAFRNWRKQE